MLHFSMVCVKCSNFSEVHSFFPIFVVFLKRLKILHIPFWGGLQSETFLTQTSSVGITVHLHSDISQLFMSSSGKLDTPFQF